MAQLVEHAHQVPVQLVGAHDATRARRARRGPAGRRGPASRRARRARRPAPRRRRRRGCPGRRCCSRRGPAPRGISTARRSTRGGVRRRTAPAGPSPVDHVRREVGDVPRRRWPTGPCPRSTPATKPIPGWRPGPATQRAASARSSSSRVSRCGSRDVEPGRGCPSPSTTRSPVVGSRARRLALVLRAARGARVGERARPRGSREVVHDGLHAAPALDVRPRATTTCSVHQLAAQVAERPSVAVLRTGAPCDWPWSESDDEVVAPRRRLRRAARATPSTLVQRRRAPPATRAGCRPAWWAISS